MSKPAPVYVIYYNTHTIGFYTQAWRCVVCIRILMAEGHCKDLEKFQVFRIRLAKDSDLLLERTNVSDSFIKSVRSYVSKGI